MFNNIKSQFNRCYNSLMLKWNKVSYINNLLIRGRIVIKTNDNGRISIGSNVRVNSGLKFNPIGGDTRTVLIVSGSGEIRIGNHVGISNSAIVAHKEIIIEDNVMIGGNCKIYDSDFHSVDYESRIEKGDINAKIKPVLIKKGAFIGAHSIILKGVTIGEKSVIGAGSVVTRNIPDKEIWAGNPARFIRNVDKY